jgi:hypothetical protein
MKGFLVSTWDNIKSYDHMRDRCIKWWAWEFIRRSSLYREVWLKAVELTSPLRNDIIKIYDIYGKPENPLSISYAVDSPDFSINSACLFGEKVNPWRLTMLHNPALETPKGLLFENLKFRANFFEDALDLEIKLKMGQACFVIDFTLPLSVQLDYVSQIASSYQETALRRQKPKRALQLTKKGLAIG